MTDLLSQIKWLQSIGCMIQSTYLANVIMHLSDFSVSLFASETTMNVAYGVH